MKVIMMIDPNISLLLKASEKKEASADEKISDPAVGLDAKVSCAYLPTTTYLPWRSS